jgi:chemotaxis protein methyltransferase CheR
MGHAAEKEFAFTRKDFDFLRSLSNRHTGIVVTDDKFDMFYSRLARRVRALGMGSFAEYCDYLRDDTHSGELTELINAVTTNLTAFFRENHHFEYLRGHALPERMANSNESKLTIWSAGCSTGEEPYSLAMTLAEMGSSLAGCDVSITATDIDSSVLQRAATGVYAQERVNGIARARLKRWFLKGTGRQAGQVRVKQDLKHFIEFRQLNLMQAWREEPKDIIFCRNVIIYFDKESKKRLVERFADTLKPGGFLFIGHSESLYKVTDRFELIGQTIYRKVR